MVGKEDFWKENKTREKKGVSEKGYDLGFLQ